MNGIGRPVEARLIGEPEHVEAVVEAMRQVLEIPHVRPPRSGRKGDGHLSYFAITSIRKAGARPAPLVQAHEAKARRDPASELEVLTTADRELRSQPWFPIRPGDVVTWWIELPNVPGGHGETLLAVDEPDPMTEGDQAGAPLRLVSQSQSARFVNPALQSFNDLWFEAGPDRLTVIRAGRVVHGRPVCAGAADRG